MLLHDLDCLQAGRADQFGHIVGDLDASVDHDLPRAIAPLRVNDVVDGDPSLEFRHAAAAGDLLHRCLIKQLEDLGVAAEFRVHGPQQGKRRKFAALVDADLEGVLFRHVEFDPTAPLGDDAAVKRFSIARLCIGDEVDTWRTMQLAHHHPLGTVDDELPATQHDRDVAEIDLFLDRLFTSEPQQDSKRPAVGQPQLPTFVWIVPRLAKFVP